MTKVTEEYLAEREQLHKNSTEGPWINPDGYCVRKKLPKDLDSTDDTEGDWKPVCLVWEHADKSVEQGIDDMEFIADAHESMPVLIEKIRWLREVINEDVPCQPSCDDYGHAENCESVNFYIRFEKTMDEVRRLRELLSEVAHSGVEFDDERIRWLSVQIGRDTWEALQEFK